MPVKFTYEISATNPCYSGHFCTKRDEPSLADVFVTSFTPHPTNFLVRDFPLGKGERQYSCYEQVPHTVHVFTSTSYERLTSGKTFSTVTKIVCLLKEICQRRTFLRTAFTVKTLAVS